EHRRHRSPRQDKYREAPQRRSEREERAPERRHDDAEHMPLARRERPPRYENERRKGPSAQHGRAANQREHQPEQLRRELLAVLRRWRFEQEYQPDREGHERKGGGQRHDWGAGGVSDGGEPKGVGSFCRTEDGHR